MELTGCKMRRNIFDIASNPLTSPAGIRNSRGRSRRSVSAHPQAPSFILSVVTMIFISCEQGKRDRDQRDVGSHRGCWPKSCFQ